MSRTILYCSDHGVNKAGDIVLVDDQTATDAIANGVAVPSVYAITPAIDDDLTTATTISMDSKAIFAAPENK